MLVHRLMPQQAMIRPWNWSLTFAAFCCWPKPHG